MSRILVVARTEFLAAIKTKAFIIGVCLMPVMVGVAIVVQVLAESRSDRDDRAFSVVDHSGFVFEAVEAAAHARNSKLAEGEGEKSKGPRFLPSRVDPAGKSDDEVRLELSDRVRKKEIFAFVEIPKDIGSTDPGAPDATWFRYYAETTTYESLRAWLQGVVTEILRERVVKEAEIPAETVKRLSVRAMAGEYGLVSRGASGVIEEAKPVNKVLTQGVPVVLMFLLFMVVMTCTPALLNSILEEKMGRISEVLLGSVAPFELMMGKLLGTAGQCAVLALLYLGGGVAVAAHFGFLGAIPVSLFFWFFIFMLFGILFFGSVYISIGAACTQLKDAQNFMMPAMVLIMIPMLTWNTVLRSPDSTVSVILSLFPPATPLLMLLRISLQPGPPAWQVALSLLLSVAATVGCVWAAGRIFRIGLLTQGKSATLKEMISWVFAK
jgi:ABC-type Na+ efflux pump permease subunit